MTPEREPRIHLVRHGPAAHLHSGWLDAEGFRAWRRAYEASGIAAGERPPAALVTLAGKADVVVASSSRRARESAALLAPGIAVVRSPLLRELELPGPPLGRLRLPLLLWAVAVGSRSGALRLLGRYPTAAEAFRVAAAADWLTELAGTRGCVVAVTHASFRKLLSGRLRALRWTRLGSGRSLRPWSVWSHSRMGA